MDSVKTLLNFAQLSQASYALFPNTRNLRDDLSALNAPRTGDFALTEGRSLLGLTETDSDIADQGYRIVHHSPDDASGFSATLFQDKASGGYVLSIRGTGDGRDIAEDVAGIGVIGYAAFQVASMYRYYKMLTTAAGQPVIYSDAEKLLLNGLRGNITPGVRASIIFMNVHQ